MRTSQVISAALAAVGLFANAVVADVDPIVIKGSKFFYKTNGTEFFIKGVAYQAGVSSNTSEDASDSYTDPLTDPSGCQRDIPLLQQLDTNAVRVYAINPDQDHSECMQMLQDAGIYLIADLSEPSLSINRDSPTWSDELYARYTSVIDALQNYTNVIGFFAGNEVSNNASNTDASPFVKAAVRDMKAYIKAKNYRAMGVGYATNDDSDIRVNLANYFNCGPSEDSIDFWGYNIYSWCGNSNYELSGYADLTAEFENYSVPVFFAEYGCNTVTPRIFTEVDALFGDNMTDVWSGGFVYEYFEEANSYGLVTVSGTSASELPDFTAYSSKINAITPTGVNSASYTPTNTVAQACPATGSAWQAATNLPPTPNQELCSCMVSSLTCVASSSINDTDIGTLFGTVCGLVNGVCAGITANGTTGVYGAYSMCNATEQLSWAFNQYYLSQNSDSSACGFDGAAVSKSSTSATGACSSLMSQAGTAGTGTVTSTPTITGGSSSGSSSSSTSTSTKKSIAGTVTVPGVDFGLIKLGGYVLVAALTGCGMILL